MRYDVRLAWIVGCMPLFGQTLPPVIKAPGEKVTLDIKARSQPGKAPVALKWEVIFPAQWMEMEGDAEAGKAAIDSGKSLQCTARGQYAYTCILSGGQKPIADGPIASFHFRIRTTAESGTATFHIDKVQSTTVDSKELNLDDTEAVVTIRRSTPTPP